jgi:archaellum component FlaC
MAGVAPTELLAEDVGELRASNRQIAVEVKDLATSVNGLRTEFAGFKASVDTQLAFIKWVGTVFTAVLIAVLTGTGGLIWSASALNSRVEQQGGRLEKVEGRMEKVEGRLDKIEGRLDKIDQQLGRLDKIEQQLGQLILNVDRIAKPKP